MSLQLLTWQYLLFGDLELHWARDFSAFDSDATFLSLCRQSNQRLDLGLRRGVAL